MLGRRSWRSSRAGFFPWLSSKFSGSFRKDLPGAEPRWRWREPSMDDRKQVTAAIRDYLARERMSREQFAFKTKLGKSTVDKLLTGLYSDRTLVDRREPTPACGCVATPAESPAAPAPCRGAAARLGQAVDRRDALRQHERRSGAGVPRRRADRGHHHGAGAAALAVRHRPQLDLRLQEQADRRARRRARSRRALRARGQRAHVRPAHPHHRPADRGRDRQARLGRTLRPRAGRPVRRAGRHHRARGRRRSSRISTPRRGSAPRAGRPTGSTPGAWWCARST